MHLGADVLTAATPEQDRLRRTTITWWNAVEVQSTTSVTNARTQAANTTIKQRQRTGRG